MAMIAKMLSARELKQLGDDGYKILEARINNEILNNTDIQKILGQVVKTSVGEFLKLDKALGRKVLLPEQ